MELHRVDPTKWLLFLQKSGIWDNNFVKWKGTLQYADLNLNSSDLAGSLFKFSLQLNQSGLSVLTVGINRDLSWLKKMYLLFSLNCGRHISYKCDRSTTKYNKGALIIKKAVSNITYNALQICLRTFPPLSLTIPKRKNATRRQAWTSSITVICLVCSV